MGCDYFSVFWLSATILKKKNTPYQANLIELLFRTRIPGIHLASMLYKICENTQKSGFCEKLQ